MNGVQKDSIIASFEREAKEIRDKAKDGLIQVDGIATELKEAKSKVDEMEDMINMLTLFFRKEEQLLRMIQIRKSCGTVRTSD